MRITKNIKVKEKYFIFLYVIILLVGCGFIIKDGINLNQPWGVKFDVVIRLILFLVNIIVPLVILQHFFSSLLFNHQKNNFIFYVIISWCIAVLCLKSFTTSWKYEFLQLFFLSICTAGINFSQIDLLRKSFIRRSNKNLQKFKMDDKDYSNIVILNKTIEQKNEMNSIIINENDYIDIDTASSLLKLCNRVIFEAKNLSCVYNTLNMKGKDDFKIKQKIRFLSLIWLLQNAVVKNTEWDKTILTNFNITYDEYSKNRSKYIDDETLSDSTKSTEDKIKHILTTKAQIKHHN